MKAAMLVVVCAASASLAQAGQKAPPRDSRPAAPASASTSVATAYDQFLLGHHYESDDKIDAAIAAYKRAMALDPLAADIPAELAGLYLRQNKASEAMTLAEQALKIAPANREANRVLGVIYAAMADGGREGAPHAASDKNDANVTKAIQHLEAAIDHPDGEADPNVRATLARLYLATGAYAKAIPLLTVLVNQEAQWQDGPTLLAEAYVGAGRIPDGVAWLEERVGSDPRLLPTLGDFYEREHEWQKAADTYGKALTQAPRSAELKTRYASALLNGGGHDQVAKARDVLQDVVSARATDARALYLLSQAQRRLGDLPGAETSARSVIAQNGKSPWGYYALAEALEERQQYQAVVDALAPAVAQFKPGPSSDTAFEEGLLLPHLGFAYQQLGQFDKALASFEDARRLAPRDSTIAAYLAEANIAAKRYSPAIDVTRAALADHPGDLRLSRIEARALRASGKTGDAVAVLEGLLAKHQDEPSAYVALAQLYSDAERGGDAVKTLQDAQKKFPSDDGVAFELGAVLDKQKQFADAEAVFQQVLARDPKNAAALNYLGYMLAERGERLDESVGLLKRAVQLEPDNGSFLDSLGWAYFKADKLDLAEDNLHRAADQLKTNSVIQDHYGEVLFKLGRYDAAITAWTRALDGDGDSIDRSDIDKKIRAAKQKIKK
ncbi:MAG TPA: tetratricopeptide repeat protein [Vicinamibacterales bacterium]|nr:tetratricopeptide repeat protein [Vicinamibacterales bacterium]